MLDARAAAVLDGDREAFLATVAGEERSFLALQERAFEGLRSLPLASYGLTAAWERAGDLARTSDVRSYPDADAVSILVVEERLRLEGIDETPANEDHFLTFVQQEGAWKIAADDDLADVGLFSARHLWDDGPVEIARSGRFMSIGHPCDGEGSEPYGCARLGEGFLDISREAMEDAEARLPSAPMPSTVAILAPGTETELGRMLQATYELDNFLAFATSSFDTTRGIEFTGHRIVLNWSRLSDSSKASLETTMTHELVHIATRALAGPFTPFFVDEGIAEHVARRGHASSLAPLRDAVEDGTFDRKLPRDHEFRTGGPAAIFLSYKESQSAIGFMIDRWGEEAFMRFYEDLGGRRLHAGTVEYHLDRALRSSIGLSLRRFERAWADSID